MYRNRDSLVPVILEYTSSAMCKVAEILISLQYTTAQIAMNNDEGRRTCAGVRKPSSN